MICFTAGFRSDVITYTEIGGERGPDQSGRVEYAPRFVFARQSSL